MRNALLAFDAGYAWPQNNLRDLFYRFEAIDQAVARTGRPQVTLDGNSAIAYGFIAAGGRYGAGYPITPWSSIMETLRTELPKYGGIFVQCEDEIASISTALGFSYTGSVGITGSAGPGLSLKMEALSWATMAELPIVVVNVQRGGPSTGMPTNVEQSDLMQAIFGSHGDTPRVVLAPKNVEDCFYIAMEAVRIAREYSTPVLLLTDQGLSSRIEAFDEPDLPKLMVDAKVDRSERPADFKPYPLDRITRHAPAGSRIASGKYPTVILSDFARQQKYWATLTANPRYITGSAEKLDGGFKTLEYSAGGAPIPWVADRLCPMETIFTLHEPDLQVFSPGDWDWIDVGGSVWLPDIYGATGKDVYKAVLFRDMELGCTSRISQGKMTGVTDS